jgi:hypothetical protein
MEVNKIVIELLKDYKRLAKTPPTPERRFYNNMLIYLPSFPIDLSADDAVWFVFNKLYVCIDKETALKAVQELETIYGLLWEESGDDYYAFVSIYLNELPRYDIFEYDIIKVKELI